MTRLERWTGYGAAGAAIFVAVLPLGPPIGLSVPLRIVALFGAGAVVAFLALHREPNT